MLAILKWLYVFSWIEQRNSDFTIREGSYKYTKGKVSELELNWNWTCECKHVVFKYINTGINMTLRTQSKYSRLCLLHMLESSAIPEAMNAFTGKIWCLNTILHLKEWFSWGTGWFQGCWSILMCKQVSVCSKDNGTCQKDRARLKGLPWPPVAGVGGRVWASNK